VSRHGIREVRRQLVESGGAGVVAVVLVTVASAWGGALWTARDWVQRELLSRGRASTLVAVARTPADATALRDQVAAAFPGLSAAALAPRTVQEELSGWFPELSTVLLTLEEKSFPALVQVEVAPRQEEAVAAWLRARPDVTMVESSRAWQARLEQAVARLLAVGFAVTAAMLVGCCVVVLLVIRLLVLAHADEIAIMRLIGAHDGDIRRPYLISGAALGLLGGALGSALTAGAALLAHRALPTVAVAPWTYGALPVAGALAGTLGAVLGLASLPSEP